VSAHKLGAGMILNAPVTNRMWNFGLGLRVLAGRRGRARQWGTRNREWHG